mgnify:FL=1
MSRTIEVKDGDTFFRNDSGSVGICRDGKRRWIGHAHWMDSGRFLSGWPECTRADFETIARIAGYEVVTPAPVVQAVRVEWGLRCEHDGKVRMYSSRKEAEARVQGPWKLVPLSFSDAGGV